ncbi:restriction endonuclease subunit S [Leifsonia sp. NPDC058248]|uniref:restriction endonuclease subunit S n=1 Tax=Leifsonia sp. NPDC058248 TaxID=3346402 RepID=UPI0036DF338C
MPEWRKCALRELGEIFDGPHATPARKRTGPYFLNIASLSNGRLDLAASDHVDEDDFARWTRRVRPRAGDLLFSYETRLGEAALMPKDVEACLGRRMALIRPNREFVDPRFLLYAYLSPYFQNVIEQNTVHGATVNRIPLNRMGSWEIPLPELSEQKAIAEVLGALDDKIVANDVVAASTAQLNRAEYRAALRAGGSSTTIGDAVVLLTRGITPRYVPDGAGVLVINQKCVRDQRVLTEPARWTDVARVKPEKLLQSDDILVNSTGQGTLGRVARWVQGDSATVDSHVTILRPDDSKWDRTIIGQAILDRQTEIEALGEGSTGQTELSRVDLGQVRISLPDAGASRRLGERLRAVDALGSAALQENRTLAATRDALLPSLMSGTLHVRGAEALASTAGA